VINAQKKRVTALIIHDNRDTREMYALYLSARGVNTVEAEDGFHGLAKATTIVPDVISTDLALPRMDGIELCRSLKMQDRTRQIPVIALTDLVSEDQISAAKRAGCVSVLLKPCSPEILLTEIQWVLRTKADS
jgi:CheY-like chemotaxis protein